MVNAVGMQNQVRRCEEMLAEVTDPELPFITIKDMGVLRRVEVKETAGVPRLEVTLTPTFSGCPAMFEIRQRVEAILKQARREWLDIDYWIQTELSPPWRSRDISERGRELLIANGIAVEDGGVRCPRCGSESIAVISEFGATACKRFARCEDCREPFEVFKSV